MRISDWSSDVCSSDLDIALHFHTEAPHQRHTEINVRLRDQFALDLDHQIVLAREQRRRLQDPGQELARCVAANAHRRDRALLRGFDRQWREPRSEEHTSELQSLMRMSYAVFGLTKKKK